MISGVPVISLLQRKKYLLLNNNNKTNYKIANFAKNTSIILSNYIKYKSS